MTIQLEEHRVQIYVMVVINLWGEVRGQAGKLLLLRYLRIQNTQITEQITTQDYNRRIEY